MNFTKPRGTLVLFAPFQGQGWFRCKFAESWAQIYYHICSLGVSKYGTRPGPGTVFAHSQWANMVVDLGPTFCEFAAKSPLSLKWSKKDKGTPWFCEIHWIPLGLAYVRVWTIWAHQQKVVFEMDFYIYMCLNKKNWGERGKTFSAAAVEVTFWWCAQMVQTLT